VKKLFVHDSRASAPEQEQFTSSHVAVVVIALVGTLMEIDIVDGWMAGPSFWASLRALAAAAPPAAGRLLSLKVQALYGTVSERDFDASRTNDGPSRSWSSSATRTDSSASPLRSPFATSPRCVAPGSFSRATRGISEIPAAISSLEKPGISRPFRLPGGEATRRAGLALEAHVALSGRWSSGSCRPGRR